MSTVNVVMALLGVDYPEAKQIIFKYRGRQRDLFSYDDGIERASKCVPPGSKDLKPMHIKYLKSRGLDPEQLQSIYDIRGTGVAGKYKFRVIAPIYYRGRVVSYQGRD